MIQIVPVEKTLDLRFRVLGWGKPAAECLLPGDHSPTTFHYTFLKNEKIVAVLSLMQSSAQEGGAWVENFARLDGKSNVYRLRAMAVDPAFQSQGLGRKLLKKALADCREKKIQMIWCDARIKAIAFYQNMGFLIDANVYEVPQVGPHQKALLTL